MLGVGAKKKTYVDDVFSTYLWTGTGSSNTTITNNINLSSDGGLVWIKNRESAYGHGLFDTVRGVTKQIKSDSNGAESVEGNTLTTFLNNGFKVNGDILVNQSTKGMASWSFKKAKGFFDVVTWDGNGTAGRVISHSLGSVPGLIMIKSTTDATAWFTYHRDVGAEKYLLLNESNAVADQTWFMNDTAPTSTGFSVGSSNNVNGSGRSYVAYVFAGGESTAATARSVAFDGSNRMYITDSDDWTLGQTYTIEGWFKTTSSSAQNIVSQRTNSSNGWYIRFDSGSNRLIFQDGSEQANSTSNSVNPDGIWYHFAWVVNSGTGKWYINGEDHTSYVTGSFNQNTDHGGSLAIASWDPHGSSYNVNGSISNLRIVKGTAVYTSPFKAPTEPLTNITNTKLLCCNNSSVTGSTVIPSGASITANNSPTASTDSPFDDPAAFTYGDSEKGIIKCGSYVGSGDSDGPEINLGWQPQWLIIKNTSEAKSWKLLDSMRGIVTGDMEAEMQPDNSNAEHTGADRVDLTSTGFKLKTTSPIYNGDGDTYIYTAIRRPDGYVGKPVEAGTDVFAMDTGGDVSVIPNFDSGFPVDFAMTRQTNSATQWYTAARLISGKYLHTDENASAQNLSNFSFDSSAGWSKNQNNSDWQSWMWKRGAGFDIVTYAGSGQGTTELHSLNAVPEMIWVKCRSSAHDWAVYHKGLNGGTNPEQKYLMLNSSAAEVDNSNRWNDTAPTATTFTVGGNDSVGNTGDNYIAMLFSSVAGISSVGSYNGSNSTLQITTGFQPRLVIIKRYTASQGWVLVDSVSGDGKFFSLHGTDAAATEDLLDFNSTGFELTAGSAGGSVVKVNGSGESFIYYAHA